MNTFTDDDKFLLDLINVMPLPVMVVDEDVRIQFANSEALALIGIEPKYIYQKRGGEALQCLHEKDVPEGCGKSEFCKNCIIRNSVVSSINGKKVHRKTAVMELVTGAGTVNINLLVTTAPLPNKGNGFALLILEDISELLQIRDLLPICSVCKKVRHDKNYWESIEGYLAEKLDIYFSHSICPDCEAKFYQVPKDNGR